LRTRSLTRTLHRTRHPESSSPALALLLWATHCRTRRLRRGARRTWPRARASLAMDAPASADGPGEMLVRTRPVGPVPYPRCSIRRRPMAPRVTSLRSHRCEASGTSPRRAAARVTECDADRVWPARHVSYASHMNVRKSTKAARVAARIIAVASTLARPRLCGCTLTGPRQRIGLRRMERRRPRRSGVAPPSPRA
jgi:hypothetical protein